MSIADRENTGEIEDSFEIFEVPEQPKSLVGGQLRDYQLDGLNWMFKLYQSNLNGILADEMGLGKTIQSIAILALIKSMPKRPQTHSSLSIVIVPKVTLGKWQREFTEWEPSLRVC